MDKAGRYSDQDPGAIQFALKGSPAATLFAIGPRKAAIGLTTSPKSGETFVNRFLRMNARHCAAFAGSSAKELVKAIGYVVMSVPRTENVFTIAVASFGPSKSY